MGRRCKEIPKMENPGTIRVSFSLYLHCFGEGNFYWILIEILLKTDSLQRNLSKACPSQMQGTSDKENDQLIQIQNSLINTKHHGLGRWLHRRQWWDYITLKVMLLYWLMIIQELFIYYQRFVMI